MNFILYYLADQSDDINGAKTLTGSFMDLPSAQAQAVSDGVAHYSVEETLDNVIYSIVFIC
jgi:hypothetical protein